MNDESQNDSPNKAQNEATVSINDIFRSDRL